MVGDDEEDDEVDSDELAAAELLLLLLVPLRERLARGGKHDSMVYWLSMRNTRVFLSSLEALKTRTP